TDLKRIVEVTKAAVAAEGIPDPYRPWLDPLPPVHALEDIQRTTSSSAICIGTIDRPEQQRQLPAVLDLDQVGSVLIYGASRSGKTVLRRTVASSLARRNSAEAVHVYAIDCAGRALEPLGRLPAVGSVLLVEDHERVNRLLRNLRATIDRRSE